MQEEVDVGLALLLAALRDATVNYETDLNAAVATGNPANVEAVKVNLRRHRTNFNKALGASLARNVELLKKLIEDSKALAEELKAARQQQQEIVSIIEKSSKLADALKELVRELG